MTEQEINNQIQNKIGMENWLRKCECVYYFWRNYLRQNHPEILKEIDCELLNRDQVLEKCKKFNIPCH